MSAEVNELNSKSACQCQHTFQLFLPQNLEALRMSNFELFPHFLRYSYFSFQRKLRAEDMKIPDEVDDPVLRVDDTLVGRLTLHNRERFYYSSFNSL